MDNPRRDIIRLFNDVEIQQWDTLIYGMDGELRVSNYHKLWRISHLRVMPVINGVHSAITQKFNA